MKHTFILLGLWIALLVLGASCSQDKGVSGTKSVVVFHSADEAGEDGEPFRSAMEKAFQKKSVKAQLHHIYLNSSHQNATTIDEGLMLPYLDSLQIWKPDIVLVNDDAALNWAFQTQHKDIFKNTPVVFAGINALNEEQVALYKNFTGFEDRIDLQENLRLIQQLTGDLRVMLELDQMPYDQQLYAHLLSQLEDTTRFVVNPHFSPELFARDYVEKNYPGMYVLTFYGAKDPWNNMELNDSTRRLVANFIKSTKSIPHLNIKDDLWNNTLVDNTHLPQFTAIRDGFNNPHHVLYAAGFFTSMQTQVEDQVDYAVQILKGTLPEELSIALHKKGYYLDYNALGKGRTLNWQQMKPGFQVVNMPFKAKYPYFYRFLWLLGFLLIGAISTQLTMVYLQRRNKASMQYIHALESEASLRAQYLYETNSSVWRGVEGMIEVPLEFAEQIKAPKIFPAEQLLANIHPDSKEDYIDLMNYTNGLGEKRKRIRLTFDEGQTWHWYDVIYNVTAHAIQAHMLSGLFINVDEDVEHQEQLKKALEQAREIAVKERFLENVTQDLEAPMHQVEHLCKKLTDEPELTAAETHELNTKIRNEVNTLLDVIDSVVQTTKQV